MARREGVLGVREDLLVELLAGTETAVNNLDVDADMEAGEADHPAGQGVYLDGLAHVEDEDLVAGTHRSGLHNQTARLGDSHEEASDLRVGHGDRAALGDLVTESRNH